MSLKLVVFSPDFPFPPNKGQRADVWRRLLAFKMLGIDVFFVCFVDAKKTPSLSDVEKLREVVSDLYLCVVSRGFLSLLFSLRWFLVGVPWYAARRMMGFVEFCFVFSRIKEFSPNAIWLEGPWCAGFVLRKEYVLRCPIFYRSHNIEFRYMAGQAQLVKGVGRRLLMQVFCFGLEKFERFIISKSRLVFDISAKDLMYWKSVGVRRIFCLPPLPEAIFRSSVFYRLHPTDFDVVFLGNLTTPNNIRGVEFLVREIAPRVLLKTSGVRFVIAGSNPSDKVRHLVAQSKAFVLMENVPDALEVMNSAHVLVNPVRTGSGVMVKMLDMLMTDAFIVTASQGLSGLPESVRSTVAVADDAAEFSDAIIAALETPGIDIEARRAVRSLFTVDAIRDVVRLMENEVPACR